MTPTHRLPGPLPMGDELSDREILRQIYETHAHVATLIDRLSELRIDGEKKNDALWMELRAIKHSIGNEQQLFSGRLELADRRSGEIERRIGEVERATKEIAAGVAPLIELRSRIWGVGAILVGAAVLLWVFVSPVYDTLVHKFLGVPPAGH